MKPLILVVDDHELARNELCKILAAIGFEAITANDGRQAIAFLKDSAEAGKPYQLVLCDWTMPNVTGIEVLRECRQNDALHRPGFIMVTAEAGMTLVMEALNAGADDYVIKPIVPDVLQKKIKRILARLAAA